MKTTNFFIYQGLRPIFISLVVFLVLFFLNISFLALFAFLSLIFFVIFFLNPEREPEEEDSLSIISPIDGKILKIVSSNNGVDIVISNFLTDPHIIRSPFDCTLKSIKATKGLNLPLSSKLARKLNNQLEIIFEKNGQEFSLHLTNSSIKIKNHIFIKDKKEIKMSKRIAFFSSGEATFSCPKNVNLKISEGSNLKAGESLIGFINNEQ